MRWPGGRIGEMRAVAFGLALIAIGFATDLTTGRDLSLSIVYIGAVACMAWFGGLRAGLVGAAGGAVANFVDALINAPHPGVAVWNGLAALVFLAAEAFVIDRVWKTFERERGEARFQQELVEDQRTFEAIHDPLTGLPNRTLAEDRLAHALARAGRTHSRTAVLLLDLDNFKVVNDSLGHHTGDELLVAVARRLGGLIRPGDTIARQGGDEFVAICEQLVDEDEAEMVADRIAKALEEPLRINGTEVFVSASIGIAVSGNGDDGPESLIRDADAALNRAKKEGPGKSVRFDNSLRSEAIDQLDTASALHRALERDELRVHYQPIIDLSTGEVLRVEALLRWQHPERGLIAPGDFLHVAEDTGLIVAIGIWVLEQAGEQLVRWNAARPADRPLQVAVNLAPRQLAQEDLESNVAETLERIGLAPTLLQLEITETALIPDVAGTREMLGALTGLGIKLAVDDFGTGYSSLTQLRRFPVDSLKIDQTFVSGLPDQAEDHAIVAGVIGLAHGLGLATTAEGVETNEQREILIDLECEAAQGYLFERPQPAEAITEYLHAHAREAQ